MEHAMLNARAVDITVPILLRGSRPDLAERGQLDPIDPELTLGDEATRDAVAIEPLLGLLNAAAEAERVARRPARRSRLEAVEPGWSQLAPPVGSVGYTGSYREPSDDVIEVSVVSVLDARGPV
jgi:hypothetical protein